MTCVTRTHVIPARHASVGYIAIMHNTKQNAVVSRKSSNIPYIVQDSNIKAYHPPNTFPSAPLYSASLLKPAPNFPWPNSPAPLLSTDLTHPPPTSTLERRRANHTPCLPHSQHAFLLPHQHPGPLLRSPRGTHQLARA
jgi:hypothetical protein